MNKLDYGCYKQIMSWNKIYQQKWNDIMSQQRAEICSQMMSYGRAVILLFVGIADSKVGFRDGNNLNKIYKCAWTKKSEHDIQTHKQWVNGTPVDILICKKSSYRRITNFAGHARPYVYTKRS